MSSVSANDFESYMNEEKKEDLLSHCMESMSVEEQGEHLMLTWPCLVYWNAKGRGGDCELHPLSTSRIVLLYTIKSLNNSFVQKLLQQCNWFDVVLCSNDICVIESMCNNAFISSLIQLKILTHKRNYFFFKSDKYIE